MSERPKLPPGCMFSEQWSEDGFIGVTRPNGLFLTGASTHEEAAASAWKRWLPPGIPRETWETMERDHQAMEALRLRGLYVSPEVLDYSPHNDGSAIRSTGRWECDSELENMETRYADDPADAIRAALGEGASDGE